MNLNSLQPDLAQSPQLSGTLSVGAQRRGLAETQASLTKARQAEQWSDVSQLLDELGQLYQVQHQWDDAIACYRERLGIDRRQSDQPKVGHSLYQLGQIYQAQRHWDDAIMRYQQSLSIQQALGDREGQAQTLIHLGLVQTQQGLYPESLPYFEAALALLPANSAQEIAVQGLLETAQTTPPKQPSKASPLAGNFWVLLTVMLAVPSCLLLVAILVAEFAWVLWVICLVGALLWRWWIVRTH